MAFTTTILPNPPRRPRTQREVTTSDLSDQAYRIWRFFLENCDHNGHIKLTREQIGKALSKGPGAVSVSLRELRAKGLISQKSQGRSAAIFALQETVTWCGSETVESSNSATRPKSRPSLDRAHPSFLSNGPSSKNISISSDDDCGLSSSFFYKKMREYGISDTCAKRLLKLHPERIADQLAALPHRAPKNAAAVLTRSISENWTMPALLVIANREAAARMGAAIGTRETHNRGISAQIRADQERFAALPQQLRAELTHKASKYAAEAANDANERRQLFELEKFRLMRQLPAGAA